VTTWLSNADVRRDAGAEIEEFADTTQLPADQAPAPRAAGDDTTRNVEDPFNPED
jgi:hypothetical protein